MLRLWGPLEALVQEMLLMLHGRRKQSCGGKRHVPVRPLLADPVLYFCPEGSYSSDADSPVARVLEARRMVQAMHRMGLRTVIVSQTPCFPAMIALATGSTN